jgi:hypothetical protein
MSKVSFSRELLGTIRFVFDKTKSRTLNATQAYDTSPSQIVLANYPATASKKLLTKGFKQTINAGTTTVQLTEAVTFGGYLGKAPIIITTTSLNLSFLDPVFVDPLLPSVGVIKNKQITYSMEDTVSFQGTRVDNGNFDSAKKSKKNKEFYYGAMTVGTGDYRAWQGKYAVLKVDLLTNNAILRVYNE